MDIDGPLASPLAGTHIARAGSRMSRARSRMPTSSSAKTKRKKKFFDLHSLVLTRSVGKKQLSWGRRPWPMGTKRKRQRKWNARPRCRTSKPWVTTSWKLWSTHRSTGSAFRFRG
eukprot:3287741-Rhodomonas_salina.1